jgi:dTDP-4-dehydrorhamnose reductase
MADRRKILLLGDSGKMGRALRQAGAGADEIICHNSRTFDAADFGQVRAIIEQTRPDLLLNTVAFLGIDPSEKEPEKAMRLNALYPRLLAECSREQDFTLVHFSTDAVFSDAGQDAYVESDGAGPVNIYGLTKFGGDCFVQSLARRYYIFRVSLLFGPTDRQTQFVERMLGRIRAGEKKLRIADDIVCSPTFTPDAAAAALRIVRQQEPYGLYHLVNAGAASLYELMHRIVRELNVDIEVERGSHRDFPAIGRKNTRTPLRSERIAPLRPWEDAVADYCRGVALEWSR